MVTMSRLDYVQSQTYDLRSSPGGIRENDGRTVFTLRTLDGG